MYSIESYTINVQHYMRYDLKSSSFALHVNTAVDYVENCRLLFNGEALSAEVNESSHDKYMTSPYLVQAPSEWNFVNTLRIPK